MFSGDKILSCSDTAAEAARGPKMVFYICLLILSILSPLRAQEVVINVAADHSDINSIMVIGKGTGYTAKGYYDNTAQVQRKWESRLMRSGYDVVARTELEDVLKVQSSGLSGSTREEEAQKVGRTMSADAIFFVEETHFIEMYSTSSDTFSELKWANIFSLEFILPS